MPKHKVLIVEDEQDIAGLIKHTLERGGDADAEVVGSGDAALKAVEVRPPDLIILDLNLPVLSGVEVCRILRSRSDVRQVPIIMLTARTGEQDRVNGLDLGADDYVTKPFSLRELSARVRAVLRRSTRTEERQTIYQGNHLLADFEAVAIAVDGEPVRLTRREFELLRYLVQTRTASFHAIGCSNGCGDTIGWSKRGRWTSTWDGCGTSSVKPDGRSKRSSDSAIDSST